MARMKIPNLTTYTASLSDFARGVRFDTDKSVVGFSAASDTYNFDFTSGALKCGYGVEEHKHVPQKATRYWTFRYYDADAGQYMEHYVYQMSNGALRYFNATTGVGNYLSGVAYPPLEAISYKLNSADVLLLSGANQRLLVWNGKKLAKYTDSPSISSMALHYERLFVTDRNHQERVYFSDDLDPTNWTASSTEGGFIEMPDERGSLNAVVAFGGYLYVFRDHGISRITAYADQREFSVTNLYVASGRIFAGSVKACGSVILFFASDGMYAFDGYTCTRILKNLDGAILPVDPTACTYHDGKYMLACRMDFNDGKIIGCESGEYGSNALIVYSPTTGEYSIMRGVDISYLRSCSLLGEDICFAATPAGSGVIAKCGAVFGEPLPKYWRSGEIATSAAGNVRSVTAVTIKSDVPCELHVIGEKRQKTVQVKPGDIKVRCNLSAKTLAVAVACDSCDCTITPPTVVLTG